MERVKLPDAARRRTKALHAGAVDNLIFFQFSRKKTNLTLLKEKKRQQAAAWQFNRCFSREDLSLVRGFIQQCIIKGCTLPGSLLINYFCTQWHRCCPDTPGAPVAPVITCEDSCLWCNLQLHEASLWMKYFFALWISVHLEIVIVVWKEF